LNLVTAAIVLWNTVYLERATAALRDHGQEVDTSLLQYLSPLGWDPAHNLVQVNFDRYGLCPGLNVRFFPFSTATPLTAPCPR